MTPDLRSDIVGYVRAIVQPPTSRAVDSDSRNLLAAIQPAEWSLTARIIRRLRSPEDQGIGDTIHRQLGAPGRWFEAAAESLGINCHCGDRRLWLNQRYPY